MTAYPGYRQRPIHLAKVRQRYDRNGDVWGTSWDWYNCTYANLCELIPRATGGQIDVGTTRDDNRPGNPPPLTPTNARKQAGNDLDRANPGSNVTNIARAARAWGVKLLLVWGRPADRWPSILALVREGRAASIATSFREWPETKECQPSFEGLHAITLQLLCDDPRRKRLEGAVGKVPGHDCTSGNHALHSDPLCPDFKWVHVDVVRAAMLAYGRGRLYAAFTPTDPEEVSRMNRVVLGQVGDLAIGTSYYSRPGDRTRAGTITAGEVKQAPGGFPLVARSEDDAWQAIALGDGRVRWVPASAVKNRREAIRTVTVEVPVPADPAALEQARRAGVAAARAKVEVATAEVRADVGARFDALLAELASG